MMAPREAKREDKREKETIEGHGASQHSPPLVPKIASTAPLMPPISLHQLQFPLHFLHLHTHPRNPPSHHDHDHPLRFTSISTRTPHLPSTSLHLPSRDHSPLCLPSPTHLSSSPSLARPANNVRVARTSRAPTRSLTPAVASARPSPGRLSIR
ncbi:uncharacterized protein BKA78DRAFT_179322 [Phyllosticta capitalensis]|uniref:uncharacterized protein n=1 Tax=Phyllosticta capitalensis TaxID=121624 RepID=UPI003131BDBB